MAGHAAGLSRGPARWGLAVAALAAGLVLWWLAARLSTPGEYYTVRCSHCHELPTESVCRFPPGRRARLVTVMRREHDAARVIDEREALILATYLEESLQCH